MSKRITQDFIQHLLAQTNIIDVVSTYTTITKKGKDHTGCCPFHQEKTPSFTVSEAKQFYHCFGCGAHGNAISFLIEHKHHTFPEAVQLLADQAGLEVIFEGGSTQNNPSHHALYALMEKATALYEKHRHMAQVYLDERLVSPDIQTRYRLGFSPDRWDNLNSITPDKPTQAQWVQAGMLIEKDGSRAYDRFRGRLMFPIRNTQGNVVGFGGRTLGDGTPKYLNSPETVLFHKNHELYGLYEARQAQPKLPYVIVVEGYMDVIALAQYQFTMAIATLGTAINDHHIKKILRYTKRILFCFDGDKAGQKASWKALLATLPALTQGIDIKFLTLPAQQDPDSFIRQQGRDAFKQALESAPRLPEQLFTTLKQRYPLDHIANKTQFAHEAMQCINQIPAGFYRDLMLNDLADQLSMDRKALESFLQPDPKPTQSIPQTAIKQPQKNNTQAPPATQLATTLLANHPELIQHLDHTLELTPESPQELQFLNHLITILKQHPRLTTGQLHAYMKDTASKQQFATATLKAIELPQAALKDELKGAMNHIHIQQQQEKINALITQSKKQSLSHDEKLQLQQLILQLNENKIE